jgi:hypothetical protein
MVAVLTAINTQQRAQAPIRTRKRYGGPFGTARTVVILVYHGQKRF